MSETPASVEPSELINKVSTTLTIFLCLYLLFYILTVIGVILTPLGIDYGEGFVLNFALQMEEYGTYYLDIHEAPYTHGAYPPLYTSLIWLGIKIFGVNLYVSRIISVLAVFLTAGIIFLILRSSKNRRLVFIFTLFTFVPYFIMTWTPYGKPDSLATFFSIAGLWIYHKYEKIDSPKRYWAHFFFICAFLTKQNAGAAPVALLVYNLLAEGKKSEFLRNGIIYFGFLSLTCLALNIATQGEFYKHTVLYHKFIMMKPDVAYQSYFYFIKATGIFLAFLFAGICLTRQLSLFMIYFFVTFIFLATIGKPGSNLNYFIEPYLALIIVSFFMVDYFWKQGSNPMRLLILMFLFIATIQLSNANHFSSVIKNLDYQKTPSYQKYESLKTVFAKIPGSVLVNNPSHAVLFGRKLWLQPFQFSHMAKHNLWDPSPIINGCYQGQFAIVVWGVWLEQVPGLKKALQSQYVLYDQQNMIYIHKSLIDK